MEPVTAGLGSYPNRGGQNFNFGNLSGNVKKKWQEFAAVASGWVVCRLVQVRPPPLDWTSNPLDMYGGTAVALCCRMSHVRKVRLYFFTS